REYDRYMQDHPIKPGRGSVLGRTLHLGKAVQTADVQADPDHTLVEQRRIGGYRTVLGVPLLREGVPIGVIILTRSRVRPFTDKQIELVTTFADQAVIAIENVRLFDEVQARTRELSESLDQQTAAAEVLRVISSSPGELEPVFHAMLANAVRLCDAKIRPTFSMGRGCVLRGRSARRLALRRIVAAAARHSRSSGLSSRPRRRNKGFGQHCKVHGKTSLYPSRSPNDHVDRGRWRCFIGKPRKPCCGQGMKVALVVRHSQQQIVCLPAVPIGKQAQTCNVVVCHLSVGLCEYATARGVRAIALPSQPPDARW